MAFNNDQFFYATLYWLEALPGGVAHSVDIAAAYGMPYSPTHAPQKGAPRIGEPGALTYSFNTKDRDLLETGITEQQAAAFFGSCYAALRHGAGEEIHDMYGDDTTHIALCRGMTGAREFSKPIEIGLEAAGLSREILPACFVYLHDNGQILVRYNEHTDDVVYPGRPENGYTPRPDFDYNEMVATGKTWQARFEVFYRIVPLEEGKEYTTSFVGADGERYTSTQTAGADEVMVISHYNDLYDTLTDAEILIGAGTDLVPTAFISPRSEYTAGHEDKDRGYSVEATERSDIVRWLSERVTVMPVTEKMQLHYGLSFTLAEPGDVLTVKGAGYKPLVTSKESLENGLTVLVPAAGGKKAMRVQPDKPSA